MPQGLRSTAAQGSALHRHSYLTILNHVSFRGAERELAICYVDLPTAKLHCVQTSLDRSDDVVFRIFACKHESVGHPGKRHVLIALPSPVAGTRRLHQA